nr:putative helicase mov-10-B.1 [Leptinotarsa decemlineata]
MSFIINERRCLLCDVNFEDETSHELHLQCDRHKIRLEYVKHKERTIIKSSDELVLEIMETCTEKKSSLSIETRPKTNIEVKMNLMNKSSSVMTILEVFQMNPHVTDITLSTQVEREIVLAPSQNTVVSLNGYFENSASFTFPLIIVIKNGNGTKEFIVKEIPIEVISEFSHLKGNSNYTWKRVKNIPIPQRKESIIPGIKPDPYPTHYKESFLLQPFKISPSFELQLTDLINAFPDFIKKGIPLSQNRPYDVYCSILKICPRITKDNYHATFSKLLDIEEHQMKIDIRDFDTKSELTVVKGGSLYDLKVPGLAEARPSLLVHDSVYIRENNSDSYKFQGIVHKVLETSVNLGLNRKFSQSFIDNKKYFIEFGFNRRSIRVEKQAVHLANEHGIIPYFYPTHPESNQSDYSHDIVFFNRDLNEEQKAAVRNILAPKSVPYIIFGPPGTGKTVTVVESVLQIWKNEPTSRIMVCAPSNAAVNEVAARLVDKIPQMDIFRLLGNIYGHSADKKMDKLKPIINVQADGTFYMPSMDQLLKYRVLVSTIVTAAKIVNGGVPDGHFSYVFIDESGYATETQTLIPIAGILSNAKGKGKVNGKIVLAGDPKQLGPLVHSNFVKYCGYAKSMIERLLDTCDIYARGTDESYDPRFVTKLIKNYRSHKIILDVPNRLFYHNELIAAGDDFTKCFIGWEHLRNENFPVMFQHVEGVDEREKDSPSFFNIQEIEEVVGYLGKLVGNRVKGMQITQDHIGVITPYKKQAEKLRNACSIKKWNSLLVGSVEQFQGKERLVIVISTVRSKNANKFEEIDKTCQLGFLKNPKRFNVALTRAKALLIVVGNANVLKADTNWSSLIKYCVDNKSVAGKPFQI